MYKLQYASRIIKDTRENRINWESDKNSENILKTMAVLEDMNGNSIEVSVKLEKKLTTVQCNLGSITAFPSTINYAMDIRIGGEGRLVEKIQLSDKDYPLLNEFGREMFLDDVTNDIKPEDMPESLYLFQFGLL